MPESAHGTESHVGHLEVVEMLEYVETLDGCEVVERLTGFDHAVEAHDCPYKL